MQSWALLVIFMFHFLVPNRAFAARLPAPLPGAAAARGPGLPGFPAGPKVDPKDVCKRADLPAHMRGTCCAIHKIGCAIANPCHKPPSAPHYNPWKLAKGGDLCCPPGQIPTGNEQPHATCGLPESVDQTTISNSTYLQAGTAAWLLVLLSAGLQKGVNILACYEKVDAGCIGASGLDPAQFKAPGQINTVCKTNLNFKTCIELGYTACLAGNSLF